MAKYKTYDVTVTVTYKLRIKAPNEEDAAKMALWNPDKEDCYDFYDDAVVNGYYENFPNEKLIPTKN